MGSKIGQLFLVLVLVLSLVPGLVYAQPSSDKELLRVIFLGGQEGELQPCG